MGNDCWTDRRNPYSSFGHCWRIVNPVAYFFDFRNFRSNQCSCPSVFVIFADTKNAPFTTNFASLGISFSNVISV